MCGGGAARIVAAAAAVAEGGGADGCAAVAVAVPVVGADGNTSSSYLLRSQSCVRWWPARAEALSPPLLPPNRHYYYYYCCCCCVLSCCVRSSDCSGRAVVAGVVAVGAAADSTGDYGDTAGHGCAAYYLLRYPKRMTVHRLLQWSARYLLLHLPRHPIAEKILLQWWRWPWLSCVVGVVGVLGD